MVSVGDLSGDFGGAGLGLQALGMVGSIFTGLKESQVASQESGIQQQNAQLEEQMNHTRQLQMQMFGQRQQMENFRNTQRLRAEGIAAGVNQGAQFGSGAQGSAAAQGAQGERNLSQNLQSGNQIFNLTGQISGNNQQLSSMQQTMGNLQGQGAIFGGLSGMGQGLLQGSGSLGHLFGSA